MKKIFLFLIVVLLILVFSSIAYAENESISPSQSQNEQVQETTASTEFNVDPGVTPDSPLYFVDSIVESVTVGNNPEKALEYKEEKIAEAKAMVEEAKPEEAQKALDNAMKYNDIVEEEVSPEMKDKVTESAEKVQDVINRMKKETKGEKWKNVNENFDETIEKEKKIQTAAELSAKIKELCETLAKLDPLQYADSCKSKDSSPKWMKEQDKELTAEQEQQAKVFFEKLSQCFETPKQCDCKGMGVQSFEDFCTEKNNLAIKCEEGDKDACEKFQSGSDSTDLLPDYLISTFKQVESKYSRAQFDNFAPKECVDAKARTPEECNKIMFKLNAPQECTDAGLTGESKEDEIKCEKIMFEKNTPQECTDVGITSEDSDAPRKCAKIMFAKRAPQECTDAGLSGEKRDDESKCRELMQQSGSQEKTTNYAPKFNRDCKAIKDADERMKCYEEFYNNAQVQVKDDFRAREMIDSNTGETITPEEEAQRKACKDKGMNTILEYENGKRVVICVDKNYQGKQGQECPNGDCGGSRCQSSQQIETLKQDCKNRGQDAKVETKGGCPWVICISNYQSQEPLNRIDQPQQTQNRVEQSQQQQGSSGVKCPDKICDDYEKMNPWACPEDCGGQRNQPQQPQNRIDQPQQPNQQNQENFCSGQAPSCAPNGAPYCQNGNWVCPQPPQPQAPQQEQQTQPQQQPQQPTQPVQEQPQQTPTPTQTPEPTPAPSPTPTPSPESSPAPVTGGVITGRVITSVYGDENSRNGDMFLDYWFKR